ncbi:MAG: rod shape-determining protein RodA [Fibromonadaceae bacterium]|jgi:rod shape determining protein RodA|nr:rod shape-determining protein RodA [Fibromonadaceae bacterium]
MKKIDWLFMIALFALIGIGIMLVYSATSNTELVWHKTEWFKQITHFAAGFAIAAVVILLPAKFWKNIAWVTYAISIITLFLVIDFGHVSKGAGRWLEIGGFRFQPSEFAKIAYLLTSSLWLSKHSVSIERPKTLLVPALLFIVPFALVLKQPNLGTSLVFVAITLVHFYWAGFRLVDLFLLVSPVASVILSATSALYWSLLIICVFFTSIKFKFPIWIIATVMILGIGAGYVSQMAWNTMAEHQKSRILTFIDPTRDPKGEGYQVIQSQIAIGSGGMFGKGFGEGSQTNLAFLPEEHTDFIFSVLGEQFGFVGASVVLVLFFVLLWRSIMICRLHSDKFANLVVAGSCAIFFFHIFVNIAMTVGFMPVTGLPLPFLSYGGSFVLTCMILVGLLVNMRLKGGDIK